MMDSGPGFVPGRAMSNGRDSQLDPGSTIAHELGHVEYAWRSALGHVLMLELPWYNKAGSDNGALRLENEVRTLRGGPDAPIRTIHDYRPRGGGIVTY